jgi:SAM-dependent methyltransferase
MAAGQDPGLVGRYSWRLGGTLREYYFFSLMVGLRGFVGPVLRDALARIVNPLSYPRLIEYRLVRERLQLEGQGDLKVLDLGSPKLFFLLLAHRTSLTLHATDVRPYFFKYSRLFLERLGHARELERRLFLETQDATALSYADRSFDRVYSISVIEHIPGSGDSAAVREIRRVLKPGGLVALTVPYSAAGYRETFRNQSVFEREQVDGAPIFYQRHYDEAALFDRIVVPSGLKLVAIDYFGEPGIKYERRWGRLPSVLRVPLAWTQPFAAQLFLKPLPPSRSADALGVCVTLQAADGA